MKLLCAQVLKDLLGDGIDVSVNHIITSCYVSAHSLTLTIAVFCLCPFFSMTRLQSLLQMQSLVSLPHTVNPSWKNTSDILMFY